MNKNIGIGILIVCFGFSNINVGWATDVVDVSPVIVQPYEIQALNQSMLARDRQNRDEEIEINNLIEENNKLIQTTLARQQDTGLQKVDQLMLNYRDALLSRDRERIASNGQRWWPSRYGDLIDLTVSVDDMKDIHRNLQSKSTLIEEKYQILNDLRDEMAVLNERLRGQGSQPNDAVIEGFKKIAQEQQDKIQMLVERLNEMDQKIAHFDEILAQKDRQIAQLRDNLARAQSEVSSQNELIKELSKQQKPIDYGKTSEVVGTSPIIVQPKVEEPQPQNAMAYSKPAEAVQIPPVETVETSPIIVQPNVTLPQQPKPMAYNPNTEIVQTPAIVVVPGDSTGKDETIRWLNKVLAAAKDKAEYFRLTAQQDNASLEELQAEVQKVKHDFALRFKDFNQYQRIIVSLKNQANQFNEQLTQKQQQVDFLKSDDRLALARQLIGLQHQEEGLLVEKGNLTMQQYMLFDRRLTRQKQQQMDALRAQLRAKIITEQNQEQLEQQVQDLRTQ